MMLTNIFWKPLNGWAKSFYIESIVPELCTLLSPKVNCFWWTWLCVTGSVHGPFTYTVFSTIGWPEKERKRE